MRSLLLFGFMQGAALAFNPSLSSEGVALHWTAPQVTITIDCPGASRLEDDDGTLAAACEAWSQLPEARVKLSLGAGGNCVHFEQQTWIYGEGKLAVTLVDANPDTGEIVNARVEVNQVEYRFDADNYDLGAVLTHELGHLLGLAHSGDAQATMYAATSPRDSHQRHPQADDRAGIAYLYDGVTTNFENDKSAGCSVVPHSGHDGLALCVLVLLGATLGWRHRQGDPRRGVMTLTESRGRDRDRRVAPEVR
jgi:Matrixin